MNESTEVIDLRRRVTALEDTLERLAERMAAGFTKSIDLIVAQQKMLTGAGQLLTAHQGALERLMGATTVPAATRELN